MPYKNIVSIVFAFAAGIFPFAVLLGLLIWEGSKNHRRYKMPLTVFLLRPPGESLRLRIEALDEKINDRLLWLIICSFFVGLGAWTSVANWIVGGFVVVAGLAIFVVLSRRFTATLRLRRDCYLGFLGERAVGEELNSLLADGWKIFHDVEFDENPGAKPFNVDHVVVGTGGIFAIETKTRRKQVVRSSGGAPNIVTFDGASLTYPWGQEIFGIKDARQRAEYLSLWLNRKLQIPCPVTSVLALPGWSVKRIGPSDLRVVSGREVCQLFRGMNGKPVVESSTVKAVIALLDQKCRDVGKTLAD